MIKTEEGRALCPLLEEERGQERTNFLRTKRDGGELGERQVTLKARTGEKLFSHM